MFRSLKASEIEVRIAQVKEKGLTVLLYKDARCDMNILDETVGPFNWKREHTRDNANCVVSLWDKEKSQWISKEDTGTESFTEKEKGLASDSFKRACFNWGIGRELYTAPFIWISNAEIKGGNGKFTCYDKFEVGAIEYDEHKIITGLVVVNSKSLEVVYRFGTLAKGGQASQPKQEAPKQQEQTNRNPNATTNRPNTKEQVISEAQAKRLFAISKSKNMSNDELKALVIRISGKNSTKELTKSEYDKICAELGA